MFPKKLLGTAVLSAFILAGAGLLVTGGTAHAAPIQMQGNFLWTQVSDDGTLGNGNTTPGLIHDATGTGTFNAVTGDYLRPGTPFEGFGVRSDQGGLRGNLNSSGDSITQTSLTDLSGGTLNHVRWAGTVAGLFNIEHNYLFDDTDENISITTVITALTSLTNVRFSRAIDPDPDNYSGGTPSTRNERGLDLNNDGDYTDSGEQSQQNFVSSEGSITGLAMAMFTDSEITHNTGIVASCCSVIDPNPYLNGGNFTPIVGFDSVGDHGIGLGFDIGAMENGASVTITYAYVFGDTVGTVDIPTQVAEPSILALFAMGLVGLGLARRRKAA
jgi:hypothetical protein